MAGTDSSPGNRWRDGVLTAKEFRELLKRYGWNSRRISKALNHDPSWLSKKLHGAREMKCEELVQICRLTGIPPHEMLGWTEADAAKKGSDEEILAYIKVNAQDDINRLARLFDKARTDK